MNPFTKNTKQALPYLYYFIPILILALAGIGNCIYLALSHYWNYTSISYASFCAISKAINCDTVSQSSWSILLNIPVALWGLLGYLLFFIFLIPTRKNIERPHPFWGILLILATIFSISAIYFGYISASKIHSYCIMCLLSYTISFALLFYCWIIRRRFCQGSIITSVKQSTILIMESSFLKLSLLTIFVSAISLQLFLPHYWQYQFPAPDDSIPNGITENGSPWIGAKNPILTIEEYTDYQCFQCAKMHHYLRRLVAEHPEKIRLIHRNYPMDNEVNPLVVPEPFHVGSGRLALLSIAAQNQNKFWQVNDAIFETIRERKTNIDIRKIAKKAQADPAALSKSIYAKNTIKKLENDIRSGLHHKITGTPSYVVNGQVYLGNLPVSFSKWF